MEWCSIDQLLKLEEKEERRKGIWRLERTQGVFHCKAITILLLLSMNGRKNAEGERVSETREKER